MSKNQSTQKSDQEILEFLKNYPKYGGADDKAILRKAFYMLKTMGCNIIIPDTGGEKDRFISHLTGDLKTQAYASLDYTELPYLVNTPRPYIIDLIDYDNDIIRKRRIEDLKLKVKTLKGYMVKLGITKEQGFSEDYTLNIKTKSILTNIAWALYSYADRMGDEVNSKKYKKIYNELKMILNF